MTTRTQRRNSHAYRAQREADDEGRAPDPLAGLDRLERLEALGQAQGGLTDIQRREFAALAAVYGQADDEDRATYSVVRALPAPGETLLYRQPAAWRGWTTSHVVTSYTEEPSERRADLARFILATEDAPGLYANSPATNETLAHRLAEHLGDQLAAGAGEIDARDVHQWLDPAIRGLLHEAWADPEDRHGVGREADARFNALEHHWQDRRERGWSTYHQEEAERLVGVGDSSSSPERDAYVKESGGKGPFDAAADWDVLADGVRAAQERADRIFGPPEAGDDAWAAATMAREDGLRVLDGGLEVTP
jgi:hypothetical protein